jgi:hypothetical protein
VKFFYEQFVPIFRVGWYFQTPFGVGKPSSLSGFCSNKSCVAVVIVVLAFRLFIAKITASVKLLELVRPWGI